MTFMVRVGVQKHAQNVSDRSTSTCYRSVRSGLVADRRELNEQPAIFTFHLCAPCALIAHVTACVQQLKLPRPHTSRSSDEIRPSLKRHDQLLPIAKGDGHASHQRI